MIYLTRRERFSAAHRMFKPELSDNENMEIYGMCSNPEWHGHNYILYVTVKGEINPDLGYVINLKRLKDLIKKEVIEKLDHKNLNTQVGFLEGVLLSTENIAIAIWKVLEKPVREEGAELHCVKIEETENNSIEYYG
ncbi:MAG: 6-carboxytetrahydropterin synthase [Marinilabiliaceae bacterium]|jgi:6-pyruvoyltetrahydropterin/6-carboxytetrahydropterin synthase|nr:6-carboxytetrahydropterin synthase [Marinilabiliaceae bacterium]